MQGASLLEPRAITCELGTGPVGAMPALCPPHSRLSCSVPPSPAFEREDAAGALPALPSASLDTPAVPCLPPPRASLLPACRRGLIWAPAASHLHLSPPPSSQNLAWLAPLPLRAAAPSPHPERSLNLPPGGAEGPDIKKSQLWIWKESPRGPDRAASEGTGGGQLSPACQSTPRAGVCPRLTAA